MSKYIATIFILVISALSMVAFATPPPDIEGQTNYGTDWTITGAEYRGNQTIILDGNLTIESGGSLTLYNVTFIMNNTNSDGQYNIEVKNGGTLSIFNGSNITDSPYDVDNESAVDYDFMFWVRDGANFTMKDSELHECGWEWPLNSGLTIEADNVTLENNTITNCVAGIKLQLSYNSNISENTVSSNIFCGIAVYMCSGTNVTGNTVSDNEWGIFTSYSIDANNFIGNTASNNQHGIVLYNTDRDNFVGNDASSNTEYGFWVWQSDNNNIIGNTASNNEHGIWLDASHDNYIWDNTASLNTLRGIQLDSSNRNNIVENDVSDNDYGICLDSSDKNNITDNYAYFHNWDGIFLHASDWNNITDNLAFFNDGRGITLSSSCGNSVTGNFAQNNDHGIYLSSSNGNNVTDNNANSNTRAGINLISADGNNISNNNALDNDCGIQISKAWPSPKSENNYVSGNNLSLNDCGIYVRESIGNTIIDNNITFNFGHGIWFDIADGNNITENYITLNSEHGIYLISSSEENNITGNRILSNVLQGIHLRSSSNNTISDNNISSNGVYGIYLREYSNRNNITDNSIWSHDRGICIESSNETFVKNNSASSNFYAIFLESSNRNNIIANNLWENEYGVYLSYSRGNDITNNTAFLNNNTGIALSYSEGNNITGNTASKSEVGILLSYSSGNNISGNTASLNDLYGILLFSSDGNNITGSIALNNYYGIRLSFSSENNITGNTASLNTAIGIYLYYSDENKITSNTVSNNWQGTVLDFSSGNNINSNNIFSNNEYGVRLSSSSRNNITGNNVSNANYGIFLDSSKWNNITGNNASSNNQDGIHLDSSSWNNIIGNYVSNNARGIRAKEDSQDNNVINSTILNSGSYDFYLSENSNIITINTTFDKSKVYFDDSNSILTVKWYMHVYVESIDGFPISDANVEVANITDVPVEGSPFTTGYDGFARWIVVTEYTQNDTNGGNPGGDNKIYSTPHNVKASLNESTGYADPEPIMDLSKVITVILDLERPIADAGIDASVYEDEPYNFDGSGSIDNTGIVNWTWDFGDGAFGYGETPTHAYTSSGFYVVVLNVTDISSNWDTDTVNIFVNNVPPIADAGSDRADDEGEQITFDGSNSIDTVSDIGSLIYTWDFGDGMVGSGKMVNHSYEDNGTYKVTLQVTDDDGATSVDSITVTVNNIAPKITPIPPQILQEDQLYTLQVTATDVKGDTLTFSDNTTMFDIDPVTGVISFTPTNADVGMHLVNVSVTDDDGAESHIDIQMNVQNTNDAPIITSSPITIAVENSIYYYNLTVEDDDLDTITYVLDLKPDGMSIDSNGRITWIPTYQQASQTFMVVVNVSDGNDFDTQTFSITVMNVNDKPIITSTPLLSATEDAQYTYEADAFDVDIGDNLIYSLDKAPMGMSIDSSTGLINWVPNNDQVGDNDVIVNVTDSMGGFATQEFTINVTNSNDAPVLGTIGPLVATEGEPFTYIVPAVDIDVGDTLTFLDDTDLFDINSTTGNITFVPSNDDVGTYVIKIAVSDHDGALDFENVLFTVVNVNNPPSLTMIGTQNLTEDESFTLAVTATDIDIGDSLMFLDNTTLFDINPLSGVISFTPTNEDVGNYFVNITVKDEGGNIAYQTVIFTVNNVNDPPLIEPIVGLTTVVGKAFNYTVAATDVDHDDTLTFSDDSELFDINPNTGEISFIPSKKNEGVHYVTITVTDDGGETDRITVTFTILEAKGEEPYDYTWLLLIVIIGLIAFFIGYLMRREEEIKIPKEKDEGLEFKEIENGLEEEEPLEEEKTEGLKKPPPPPPPPEEEETVEFEAIEEKGLESGDKEIDSEEVDTSEKDEPLEFDLEDEKLEEKNTSPEKDHPL